MDNLLSLALEAHNDEMNHHRRYVVTVGQDLFGAWTVSLGYGRVGQDLRVLRFSGQDEQSMQRLVREHLRRRLSAPRRIGCAYRLRDLGAATGFKAGAWLPAEALNRFLVPETVGER